MLDSTVLEVALGLCFTFAAVSLIVSSLNEAISSLFKLRALTLLNGVKALLNDQHFTGLALNLYNHALVNPRASGNAKTKRELTSRPSYIDGTHFAVAFIETLQTVPGKVEQLSEEIEAIDNPQLRTLLRGMYHRAGGNAEHLQRDLASWFDAGMSRVSGAYKRRTQLVSFGLGLSIAVLLNIDALHLFGELWRHPTLVHHLQTAGALGTSDALAELDKLPMGWQQFPPPLDWSLLSRLCGWLITAISVLFGAPFWFDMLQRVVNLRGTSKATSTPGKGQDGT